MAKFPEYSINNCILIASQCPTATLVCGYKKWQSEFHRTVNKNEHGIMIIAPVKYKAEGEDLDYLVKQIYRSVAESLVIPYEFTTVGKDLMDFDYAKDKIIMVAVNAEKNKELLADVPYQLKEDLALIYKVKLGTNNEEMATVTIHNNLLKTWGATKEEIHELAMKNTRELLPVTIQSIDEVMRELLARDGMPKEIAEAMFTEMPADQQMYVISNKPKGIVPLTP